MLNGNINTKPGTAGKGLNSYFRQAAGEKVNFTQENAKQLITNHIASGSSAGLLGKLSLSTGKLILGCLISAVVVVSVIFMANDDSTVDKNQDSKKEIIAYQEDTTVNVENELFRAELETDVVGNEENGKIQEEQSQIVADNDKTDITASNVEADLPDKQVRTKQAVNKPVDDEGQGVNDEIMQQNQDKEEQPKPLESDDDIELAANILNRESVSETELVDDALALNNEISAQEISVTDIDYTPIPDDNINSTLVGEIRDHSGYASFSSKKAFKTNSWLLGGKLGWTINHKLTIGGAGYGLVNAPMVVKEENGFEKDMALKYGYGGLYFEYIHESGDLVHAVGTLLIGAGGYSFYDPTVEVDNGEFQSAFFALEPGLCVELNLHKYVRIGAECTYLFIGDQFDKQGLRSDVKDLGLEKGFTFGLYLKAGIF